MNRTIFTVAGMLSASSFVLLDSAVKGSALLVLAALVALMLTRDSAATRHLVWLLAMIALLAAPFLSALLPQWRVLPEWAGVSPNPVSADLSPPASATSTVGAIESPQQAEPAEFVRPSETTTQPAAEPPDLRPAFVAPPIISESPVWNGGWIQALPIVWAMGCAAFILRLAAARWLLWNSERRATIIGSRGRSANAMDDPVVTALEAACLQLGIGRPVTLLIQPDKAIPQVWGILRCRLLLPAAAREWSGAQLRSVLLHELAHVKRRDLLAQLLTQIACGLHWFNPLVWFAAWRLGVERERACDDLVLAGGVRPSAYAGHLLDVVTELVPARWTHSCGLAMARKSSLEGRLGAVLGKNRNRRKVSMALAALALAMTVGVAVPIAMLRATDEQPGAAAEQKEAQKPQAGVKLDPKLEAKLKWGEPVNGLRAALVIRTLPDEANAQGVPDLYLLVQNVSKATIHFNDTIAAPNVRYLTFHRDEIPQGRTKIDVPTRTDALLQPRETTFVLMCPRSATSSRGQNLAAGMLKESHMFLIGQMNIDKAPPGAWTGKLISGATNGAAAQFDPPTAPKAGASPGAAKLPPGAEQNLKWGEPVNGLRAALMIRHATEKPKAGDLPDLYLALQNVANAPIRLTDADVAANVNLREVLHKKDGRILYIMGAREPALGDFMLQPREVALLPMFDSHKKFTGTGDPTVDGHTLGSHIAEGVLKNTNETLVARLKIEKAPAGAWTGKLVTDDTSGTEAAGGPQPKSKEAQLLFKVWQEGARVNGKIPGGALGPLARTMARFIELNPTHEAAPKFTELLKRIDMSHDWTPADAVALLDQMTAIYASLPSWVQDEPRFFLGGYMQRGHPLTVDLKKAPWGDTQPSGLRLAWLLEPNTTEHPLGTPLKSRILFHNAGKDTVLFRALTFNQPGGHKANGGSINITSTYWTTIGSVVACRLAPGEFTEMIAPGIGVGPHDKEAENWRNIRIGSWIGAQVGDEVTFTPAAVLLNSDRAPSDGEPDWWLNFIKNRLSLAAPLPADAAERGRLLERAVHHLFGTQPTAEERAAFAADREPNALDSLAKRLAKRAGTTTYTGSLTSGPTKFRVAPPDPDAAKKPRIVSNPGWYTLGDNVKLEVSRRFSGERIVNEASIRFFAADQTKPAPGKPHEIKLPDGYNTWAAAWLKDTTVLWVKQNGNMRSYDFTNPAQVKETTLKEPAHFEQVPRPILDALGAALAVPDAPKEPPAAPK
jgi:beta-lactamase regulating signal transducer with metallopeptidase domain